MKRVCIKDDSGKVHTICLKKDDYVLQENESIVDENATLDSLQSDEIKKEIALQDLRVKRDELLRDSDFSQLTDVGFDASLVSDWKDYRQELRDLPENTEDPFSVVWPTVPS